ncbi:hypothetical protein D3C80_1711560 [compost metagenome]
MSATFTPPLSKGAGAPSSPAADAPPANPKAMSAIVARFKLHRIVDLLLISTLATDCQPSTSWYNLQFLCTINAFQSREHQRNALLTAPDLAAEVVPWHVLRETPLESARMKIPFISQAWDIFATY